MSDEGAKGLRQARDQRILPGLRGEFDCRGPRGLAVALLADLSAEHIGENTQAVAGSEIRKVPRHNLIQEFPQPGLEFALVVVFAIVRIADIAGTAAHDDGGVVVQQQIRKPQIHLHPHQIGRDESAHAQYGVVFVIRGGGLRAQLQ